MAENSQAMSDDRETSSNFHAEEDEGQVESTQAETATPGDESVRLQELEADVRDQNDLERDIGREVCEIIWNFHGGWRNPLTRYLEK